MQRQLSEVKPRVRASMHLSHPHSYTTTFDNDIVSASTFEALLKRHSCHTGKPPSAQKMHDFHQQLFRQLVSPEGQDFVHMDTLEEIMPTVVEQYSAFASAFGLGEVDLDDKIKKRVSVAEDLAEISAFAGAPGRKKRGRRAKNTGAAEEVAKVAIPTPTVKSLPEATRMQSGSLSEVEDSAELVGTPEKPQDDQPKFHDTSEADVDFNQEVGNEEEKFFDATSENGIPVLSPPEGLEQDGEESVENYGVAPETDPLPTKKEYPHLELFIPPLPPHRLPKASLEISNPLGTAMEVSDPPRASIEAAPRQRESSSNPRKVSSKSSHPFNIQKVFHEPVPRPSFVPRLGNIEDLGDTLPIFTSKSIVNTSESASSSEPPLSSARGPPSHRAFPPDFQPGQLEYYEDYPPLQESQTLNGQAAVVDGVLGAALDRRSTIENVQDAFGAEASRVSLFASPGQEELFDPFIPSPRVQTEWPAMAEARGLTNDSLVQEIQTTNHPTNEMPKRLYYSASFDMLPEEPRPTLAHPKDDTSRMGLDTERVNAALGGLVDDIFSGKVKPLEKQQSTPVLPANPSQKPAPTGIPFSRLREYSRQRRKQPESNTTLKSVKTKLRTLTAMKTSQKDLVDRLSQPKQRAEGTVADTKITKADMLLSLLRSDKPVSPEKTISSLVGKAQKTAVAVNKFKAQLAKNRGQPVAEAQRDVSVEANKTKPKAFQLASEARGKERREQKRLLAEQMQQQQQVSQKPTVSAFRQGGISAKPVRVDAKYVQMERVAARQHALRLDRGRTKPPVKDCSDLKPKEKAVHPLEWNAIENHLYRYGGNRPARDTQGYLWTHQGCQEVEKFSFAPNMRLSKESHKNVKKTYSGLADPLLVALAETSSEEAHKVVRESVLKYGQQRCLKPSTPICDASTHKTMLRSRYMSYAPPS